MGNPKFFIWENAKILLLIVVNVKAALFPQLFQDFESGGPTKAWILENKRDGSWLYSDRST